MKRWIQKKLLRLRTEDTTIPLNWNSNWYHPVHIGNRQCLVIGNKVISSKSITIAEFDRKILVRELLEARQKFGGLHPLQEGFSPQLAAVAYESNGDPDMMSMYFPIFTVLNDEEKVDFHSWIRQIMESPNFDLRIHGGDQAIIRMPMASIGYIIIGHIVEIFFRRLDLLRHLFTTPHRFDIYLTAHAYTQDGGVAGGCYDPNTASIKLMASRLFEGFYSSRPGVAPFIHEFGHMLDYFDVKSASIKSPNGLLPGMAASDGNLFSYDAKEAFLTGKRIELERYQKARDRRTNKKNIPIGHPYVFQNDGEFLAGYLEMFFRNPNYFHSQNPTLYDGFQTLFQQDPRAYIQEDFMQYVNENQSVYLGHRNGIQPPGLKIL